MKMTAYRIGTPVVPQYVADWYEENKDDFEHNLAHLIKDYLDDKIENDKLKSWFDSDYNTYPIQTLVNMHQFGYKVKEKKEKLYTVKIPNPNYPDNVSFVLCKNKSGEVSMIWTEIEGWRNFDMFQLTEEEIKSYPFATRFYKAEHCGLSAVSDNFNILIDSTVSQPRIAIFDDISVFNPYFMDSVMKVGGKFKLSNIYDISNQNNCNNNIITELDGNYSIFRYENLYAFVKN